MSQTIAIIGAGYSGISVLYGLYQKHADVRVLLFEQRDQLAQGAAYSTPDKNHLLNVAAASMTAIADDPNHFVNWLRTTHFDDFTPHANVEGQYVPRFIYGRYIRSLLDEVINDANKPMQLEVIQAQVTDVAPGFTIKTGAKSYEADQVVLATGNYAPQCICPDLLKLPQGRYIHNPWEYNAIQDLPADKDVVILGTGLTMVDIIVSLRANGHKGNITALSRRGLFPRAHKVHQAVESFMDKTNLPTTACSLMRIVHQKGRALVKAGADWRAVIDSLRPYNALLWQNLSLKEKHRFMRHVRPYWDVLRHRIAPEIFDIVQGAIDQGQLTVRPGRLRAAQIEGDKVACLIKPRGKSEVETIMTDHIINAVGPSGNIKSINDPLLNQLMARGLLSQDPSQLGPLVFDENKSVDQTSLKCYLHGPMTKAKYWEMIAVPDIRHQTNTLVAKLLENEQYGSTNG